MPAAAAVDRQSRHHRPSLPAAAPARRRPPDNIGVLMSATLIAKDLAAGHGDRVLFSGLDLVVAPGDVIGLVGVNGAGKSTLLRILAGLAPPEQGTVAAQPARRRTSATCRRSRTGGPARRSGTSWPGAPGSPPRRPRWTRPTEALTAGAPGADDAYATALERWLALGGADLDERAEQVAADLGLGVDLDAPMTTPLRRPGGPGRAGVAAAQPVRHLPARRADQRPRPGRPGPAGASSSPGCGPARCWSATTASSSPARSPACSSSTWPSSRSDLFGGGYAAYLEEREVARRHARDDYEEYADTRAGLEARARTQRAWMEKGVRNARRKATDNDKIGSTFRGETSEKQAAKARQTERLIERLDVVEEPRKEWELRMEIAAAPRAGAVVATLRGAVVRRGDFTLGPVDLQIDWADRVAITGANGSGKSTLLGALLGRLPLDAGHALARPGRGGRRGRPGPRRCSSATSRCSTRSAPPCRSWRRPTYGPCWPSSGCAPAHVLRPAGDPLARASGPGPRSRCCRPAA